MMEQDNLMVKGCEILSGSQRQDRDFRVKTYDFKRPDKFSLDHIRTISILHETFCRLAAPVFSSRIQKKAEICIKAVDQLNFGEFLQSIPNPSTLAIFNMTPLKGSAILEIDPGISSVVLDRMCGGQGSPLETTRELSLFERSLMESVTGDFLNSLKHAWEQVIHITPVLGHIETQPQMAQILPASEMVILVSFELKVGEQTGFMNLCIPFLTIEPVIKKLSAQYWYSTVRKRDGSSLSNRTVSSLEMDSEVICETGKISLKDLGELKKGSLVKLSDFREGRASLRFGGKIVQNYRFKKGRKKTIFTLLKDSGNTEDELFDFFSDNHKKADANEPFESLTLKMDKFTEKISRRIEQLSNSQDHLSDQVFLQSSTDLQTKLLDSKPFSFIRKADLENLYQLISEESFQLTALLLSRLDSDLSAGVLGMFSEAIQPELIRKIGTLDKVSPEVIIVIEGVLKSSFNLVTENLLPEVAGVEKIVEILNVSSRAVEKNVIMNLENMDRELTDEIKNRMFVFEDIIMLDGPSIGKIAENVDLNDLCLALRVVSEVVVKQHIFDNISPELAINLDECLKKTGRVKISDVDKAQLRIVSKIRELEEIGMVVVARPDEIVE